MDWFLYGRDLRHERVNKFYHLGIFRTPSNIYHDAFLWKWLIVKSFSLFSYKSFILDVWQGPKYA